MSADADPVPLESYALARKWLDMLEQDVGDSPKESFHALSILLVSLISQWLRWQPDAGHFRILMTHMIGCIGDGFEAGVEMFRKEHPGELGVEPIQVVHITRPHSRPVSIRRRPPRRRPV